MEDRQADAMVRYLAHSFPQRELPPGEVVIWLQTMRPVDATAAQAAIEVIRVRQTWLPSYHEFLDEVDRQARLDAARQGERMLGVPRSETTTCGTCSDQKFVFIDEAEIERITADMPGVSRSAAANTVTPCPTCRPVEYARWEGGHLGPKHDRGHCEECVRARKGQGAQIRAEYQERIAAASVSGGEQGQF